MSKSEPLMNMEEALQSIFPAERIRTRLIDLVSFAADAGFYYLRPKAVVNPVSEQEIKALFNFSHQHTIPLTFRTAGTSLSGQSITDGILVDLSKFWNTIKIEEDGAQVRVQPGITGGMVNAMLRKYGKKIGPDPASIHVRHDRRNRFQQCERHVLRRTEECLSYHQVYTIHAAQRTKLFNRDARGL